MILRNGVPFDISLGFEYNGLNYIPYWYIYATPEERESLGFTEIPDPVMPDSRFYYINSDGTITQKPIEQCKAAVKTQLATIRWEYESAGIVYNNYIFLTDSQSKVNYLGAMQKSLLDPNYIVLWKAVTETDPQSAVFITLSANEMVNIASNAISYVTDCFINENNISLQIDNSTTLNELTAIDLNANWPSRYFN